MQHKFKLAKRKCDMKKKKTYCLFGYECQVSDILFKMLFLNAKNIKSNDGTQTANICSFASWRYIFNKNKIEGAF